MDSPFLSVQERIDATASGAAEQQDDYFLFEPWDVAARPEWLLDQMGADGIAGDVAPGPHPFQSGFITSNRFLTCILAGSQAGKSVSAQVRMFCMATGDFPFCYRHDAGVDTGVRRRINRTNIRRFGRKALDDGRLLDFDENAEQNGLWDCGTIVGVGKFPRELVCEPGDELWIGTYQKAFSRLWWPRLMRDRSQNEFLIPEHFIDRTRGNEGYTVKENVVHLVRGVNIVVITYESGYERFEARKVFGIFPDEEPPDQKILQSMIQHARFVSISMTPYNGITFMKDVLFPSKPSAEKAVFHASQYDSPYQTRAEIEVKRESMQPWDVAARVWGVFASVTGTPFYDRSKLDGWLRRFVWEKRWRAIVPEREPAGYSFFASDGLPTVAVRAVPLDDDDRRMAWNVFEDPLPGAAYVVVADAAEGGETPGEEGDFSAALAFRMDGESPRLVATLRSTLDVFAFARQVAYCARWYNNASLCPEAGRGSANASVYAELREWPWWIMHTATQDSTGRVREKPGFDVNAGTRKVIFEMIRDTLNAFAPDVHPGIPCEYLLRELSAAVRDPRNGRCDHDGKGSIDLAICYGICLYVARNLREQMTCNDHKATMSPQRNRKPEGTAVPLGMGAMGYGKR
jgi:hypothetical protein